AGPLLGNGGLPGLPCCRFSLGHLCLPDRFKLGEAITVFLNRRTHPRAGPSPQCRRNMPSTARNSAGFISLEWATVTENKGPSSFCCQKARKSWSAGNFGNRS